MRDEVREGTCGAYFWGPARLRAAFADYISISGFEMSICVAPEEEECVGVGVSVAMQGILVCNTCVPWIGVSKYNDRRRRLAMSCIQIPASIYLCGPRHVG